MVRFSNFFRPSKESQEKPSRPLASAAPSVEGQVDYITEDGNTASINNAKSNVSFRTTVSVENEESGLELSAPRYRERAKVSEPNTMTKCKVCLKVKIKIDPPTQDCDARLKNCVKFLSMRANVKCESDYRFPDGTTHSLPNKLRSLRKFLNKHFTVLEKSAAQKTSVSQSLREYIDKNSTADYAFEIRTMNLQAPGNEERWHSYFWVPRNWDPEISKWCSGIRNNIFWRYYGGSFQVYPGHFFCPMDGIRNCHNSCKTVKGTAALEDFRLLQNVNPMTVRMRCRCSAKGGKNTLNQRWEIRLYKRMSEGEKRDEKESKYLERLGFSESNDDRKSMVEVRKDPESSSWANPGLQFDSLTDDTRQVIEEADRVIKKSKEKQDSSKSLESENGPLKIKEETNTEAQNEPVDNDNFPNLVNENIAFVDYGASQDSGLEGPERVRETQPSVTQEESISPTGSVNSRDGNSEEENLIQHFRSSVAQDEKILAARSESPQSTSLGEGEEFLNSQSPSGQCESTSATNPLIRRNNN
ncbi:hypothetical protein BOTCAL_0157g00180 [Botryotinia calthae]|uniref:Uncharacterized protein n=1 Tax=Botryotinia calthae TaxID=38488 RepID=A0A4Y8D464_9HELO|nr:hypothetical protein BOTCAL_0157g00180 [Botryotinia calthae]